MTDPSANPPAVAVAAAAQQPPPWHKHDPVLRRFSLPYLNDNGFINLDKITSEDNMVDDFGQEHAKTFSSKGYYSPTAPQHYHPLFGRSQWRQKDLNDEEFQRLEPVFQLATLLLEEGSMAGWMHAMMDGLRHRQVRGKDRSYKWFRTDRTMTRYNHYQLWGALNNLVAMHFWKLGDTLNCFGETDWFSFHDEAEKDIDPKPSPQPGDGDGENNEEYLSDPMDEDDEDGEDYPSDPMDEDDDNEGDDQDDEDEGDDQDDKDEDQEKSPEKFIVRSLVHKSLVDLLLEREDLSKFCKTWMPGTDLESLKMRIKVLLAITLVHELMHSLFMNTNRKQEEPFYMDTRVAELGFQWERELFGSRMDCLGGNLQSCYGLAFTRWPGPLEEPDNPHDMLMSHAKWRRGNHWYTEYAVHMAWVRQFFTDDFWNNLERNGVRAFWPKKLLGVRIKPTNNLRPGESPTQPEFEGPPRPDSPLSSPDDADTKVINKLAQPYPTVSVHAGDGEGDDDS